MDLLRFNPYLTGDIVGTSRELLIGLMLRANRVCQAMRAVKALKSFVRAANGNEKRLAGEALARELNGRRQYIQQGKCFSYSV